MLFREQENLYELRDKHTVPVDPFPTALQMLYNEPQSGFYQTGSVRQQKGSIYGKEEIPCIFIPCCVIHPWDTLYVTARCIRTI